MANPLKDWAHAKKKEVDHPQSIPLVNPPEWLESKQVWRSLLSRKVSKGDVPNLKGKFFFHSGTLYEAMSQEHISDAQMIRVLSDGHPPGERRTFFYVYMEEIDSRLALSLGRKKSNGF